MKRLWLVAALILTLSGPSLAQTTDPLFEDAPETEQRMHWHPQRSEIRFLDGKRTPNLEYQRVLRARANWQNFLQDNGDWWVQFNESNAKPMRAVGKPIVVSGADMQTKAMNFINQKLSGFDIPVNELTYNGTNTSRSHNWVRFGQVHNGHEVLGADMVVKITSDSKVIMFGANVYSNINIHAPATLTAAQAETHALTGVQEQIDQISSDPTMKILPYPGEKGWEFHLVYEVMLEGTDGVFPCKYYSLVDAASGEVLYRFDQIAFHGSPAKRKKKAKKKQQPMPLANIEIDMEATVYTTHSYNPSSVEGLPNMDITINGTTYQTDQNGSLVTTENGPLNVIFDLQGDWSTVETNNVTPSFNGTYNGVNTVTFDNDANIRELSAYRSVNMIHDHMKSWLPSFTGMDFSLPTNIDVAGTCNAFYNGSSINFYAPGGGCLSYANVADVVYHEYGHGINDNFYQSQGTNFWNGAMNEGYADWWAMSLTINPILGVGGDDTDPTDFIRRYDSFPKVYPDDITGQVHNDGEVICGAWWDTYLLMGSNMTQAMQLWIDAYPGTQGNLFNGNEGQAYTQVLIDALQADDVPGNGGDNDITNGTPNMTPILTGFDMHGITLISNGTLTHTDLMAHTENQAIDLTADLNLTGSFFQYLGNVQINYTLNATGTWQQVPMTNTSGNTWEGQIPAQPAGTVVAYYISTEDIFTQTATVEPIAADATPYANTPYFILVGYVMVGEDNVGEFNTDFGQWTTGVADDNNTTGTWVETIPLASWSDVDGDGQPDIGDPTAACQPGYQVTPGGEICFVTGNATSENDGIGTNDVDAGKTTLESPVIDVTSYQNPTFSYWKWYTNNPYGGANPKADWWQVFVSDDGGSSWIPVESTQASQLAWRRYAFRIQDYVGITNQFQMRFVASDSTHLGQNLDGGSLIEAALDDIRLWDDADFQSIPEADLLESMQIYPNPAAEDVTVEFTLTESESGMIYVYDAEGRIVIEESLGKLIAGEHKYVIPQEILSSGLYNVRLVVGQSSMTKKLKFLK